MGGYSIKFYSFLIISLTSFVLLDQIKAVVYEVGDSEGWTQSVNYQRWSDKYNFTVGDVLAFTYVKGQHDVYQVTEDTYRSCDISTGALQSYDSGRDQVTLTQPKTYWFLCSISGHCLGGMKFAVDVKAGTAANNGPTGSSPPSEPTLGNGVATFTMKWKWVSYLVAFSILVLLN